MSTSATAHKFKECTAKYYTMQNSPDDKCRKVYPDPELQKWHKQFNVWQEWVDSKEYALAFKTYYKQGSVPTNRYPSKLIRRNEKKGTMEIARLNGVHEYKDFQDTDFLSCAIYNEQLAKWKRSKDRQERRKANNPNGSSAKGVWSSIVPKLPLIGWILFIGSITWIFVNPGTADSNMGLFAIMFLLSAVVIALAFYYARGILSKILHVVGCVCAVCWALPFTGLVAQNFIFTSISLTFLAAFLLVMAGIKLLWIRVKFGAAGYGWNEGSERYSQRKRRW